MKDFRKINRKWVDFSEKIVYLEDVFFDRDEDKLIDYFTNPKKKIPKASIRKKIRNWKNGKTKKPTSFDISNFYKYSDGSLLFPQEAFKKWTIETFKQRGDNYLNKKDITSSNRIVRYIYYFNFQTKKMDCYTISYIKKEGDIHYIELTSHTLTEDMTYHGTLFEYQNMLYIFVQNRYDHMVYILENIINKFNQSFQVYGTGLCKDFNTKRPKAYISLFTSEKLTYPEEIKYRHKINNSNLLLAKEFSRYSSREEDYLFENFYQKIKLISDDLIPQYNKLVEKGETNRYYNDVIIGEFKSYLNLLSKASRNFDFYITHRRKLDVYSLENHIDNKSETEVCILYTLNFATLSFFFHVLSSQENTISKNSVHLEYILVIEDRRVLNKKLISSLKELEKKGVKVRLLSENHTYYTEFMLIFDINFALLRRGNNIKDSTFVTKNREKIDELYDVYYMLEPHTLSLDSFLNTQCILNGRWYSYSYSSSADNTYYHSIPIDINNNECIMHYPREAVRGTIHRTTKQIVLVLEESVIKISTINIDNDIFRISIIGREQYIHTRDILVYGIMSRQELKREDVLMLLNSIHKKDGNSFRLKISDKFDSVLAQFKSNRD